MSSESSTSGARVARDSGFQPRHLYLLLAMAAATWAVVVARDTHPAALLLLSAAILAAGLTAAALHQALSGFLTPGASRPPAVLEKHAREALEGDKVLVLRAIKELEFDHNMRKISDADFAEIGGRLRERAMAIMAELDRLAEAEEPQQAEPSSSAGSRRAGTTATTDAPPAARYCGACGAAREPGARFCVQCGASLT